MRIRIPVPVRLLYVCFSIGLLLSSTVAPVWCEEKEAPAAIETENESAPSLADVVYQAGALKQRLSVIESEPEIPGNWKILEAQLKQADSEADRFQERLNLFKDQGLQSYQKLAALKGDLRAEADAFEEVTTSLQKVIQKIESQRRVWLDEKKRPQRMFVIRPYTGQGAIGDLQVDYGRYRQIDTVSFPHRIRVSATGSEQFLQVDYQRVLLNESLEEDLFRFVPPPDATQLTDGKWNP